MFHQLVAIEPINLDPASTRALSRLAEKVVLYDDLPRDNAEIIQRIGQADGVLLSYTSAIDAEVIEACPSIRYIGMCCSLYSPESANVDIRAAQARGITVLGVRDYGDEGVAEYVVSELVRLLHGFGSRQWKSEPTELTGVKVGILGLGTSGSIVGRAIRYFGADLFYYSRTRKPDMEAEGFHYRTLEELLGEVDILCTCLNKNVILLHEREFSLFGNGKILVNTSIGPSFDLPALRGWLANPENYFLCDTLLALGDPSLRKLPNVSCVGKSSGASIQTTRRLGRKVIQNIESFFGASGQ
ncbi:NAD(P)-dependent oxidoreductase [Zongyangia hominis]|uniref:Dihydrofolate reductase n=1 Tax=Zongyangia hominis TaxID=2763677 RepID=A0A926I6A7_9FIRM|nr:NAD(P)-dependent oxidoreductase [Zongyangia hominis]MBC8569849.1 dihydrofolate reductase [Zongyangia hominis]